MTVVQPTTLRRGAAVYMAVLSTTLIVSVLGLTAAAIVRVERREVTAINNRLAARSNARSAVELALRRIASDSNWRMTYANGVETTAQSLGASARGTVSFKLVDSDGSLTDSDTNLRIKGIGRLGSTVQVSSVQILPGPVGPGQLRAHTTTSSTSTDTLEDDKWWAQFIKPTLPSGANGWRISGIDLYIRRETGARTFRVRIYSPLATNWPSGIIDSVDLTSNSVPTDFGWYSVPFNGAYWLDANEGVVIALETNASQQPVGLRYSSGSVSEANSALIRGNPSWNSYETNKALHYRIHGYYTTSDGVAPIAGTWTWDVP
ncbi:MAG TPA: hypothetical protein VEQ85_15405 [Lacipirellulaceae bacterium]|nr:hypothetical protein [Lacipirellulaceae bacterium]